MSLICLLIVIKKNAPNLMSFKTNWHYLFIHSFFFFKNFFELHRTAFNPNLQTVILRVATCTENLPPWVSTMLLAHSGGGANFSPFGRASHTFIKILCCQNQKLHGYHRLWCKHFTNSVFVVFETQLSDYAVFLGSAELDPPTCVIFSRWLRLFLLIFSTCLDVLALRMSRGRSHYIAPDKQVMLS